MSPIDASRKPGCITALAVVVIAIVVAWGARSAAADDDTVCMPFPPAPRMLVWQMPFSDADATTDGRLPLGSRIVLVSLAKPPRVLVDLTKDFAAAGLPDVSFDGERVLFVGRRKNGDRQGVFEIGDRGVIREVLWSEADCLAAVHLSSIYTLDAEAPQPRIAFTRKTPDWNTEQVYSCATDGTDIQRLTYEPHGATCPRMLSDGRLIYVGGYDLADSTSQPTTRTRLMCMFPDGTDGQLFAPPPDPRSAMVAACEIDGSRFAYLLRTETAKTPSARDTLLISRINRSLHTAKHGRVPTEPLVAMRSPFAWPDGRIAVSGKKPGQMTWGIYLLSADKPATPQPLFDAPDWHDVAACPLVKQRTPHGRSSVVRPDVNAARLYGIDVYLSSTEAAKTIARGEAKRLRIIQALPTPSMTTAKTRPHLPEIVIGEAPIESDGSFSLVVPASVPLRLETLNADGKPLQAMRNWFRLMPNESRGCVGCHADPELSPPNRHPIALWREPHCVGGVTPPEVEDAEAKPRKPSSKEHIAP